MPIDPTIALGFRSPTASTTSSQDSALASLSQLMGLRQLIGKLRGQNLGTFMTGGDVNAGQGYPVVSGTAPAGGATAASLGLANPPALPPPTGALITGLSRYGKNVHSTDGGKTWINSQTGQPVTGDIYQQTVI